MNETSHRVPGEQANGPQQQQQDHSDSEHGIPSDGQLGTFISEPEVPRQTLSRAAENSLKGDSADVLPNISGGVVEAITLKIPGLGNRRSRVWSLTVLPFLTAGREGYRMTSEERVRMESLCKRIAVEKDPLKFEKLALELNDLVSATLKSVQPKLKDEGDRAT